MREFKKPVFIAEYAYNAEQGDANAGHFGSWNKQMEGYPLTEKGQADALRDLTTWGLEVGLSGIRPYGAALITPPWQHLAMFKQKGHSKEYTIRASIKAMHEALRQ